MDSARNVRSAVPAEPLRPRPANVGGQNELVPKAKQLVDVDVATYVLVVALA